MELEGRYRILQELAKGGMSTVFLAEHVLIKRRVAVKVMRDDLATDREILKRFTNEAMAAGTLGHANIVESTDMGFTPEGVPFIVFEYLEGTLLTDEIYRTGGMPIRRALRIALQIASALEAAHNAGIVHLDLKSDNVFLTDKGGTSDHVKVLDFGISKFMEAEGDRAQRGLLAGTPEYMAPEQIATPDDVDKRADIYGLGVVLYEMLAAQRPFDGATAAELMTKICTEAPAPFSRPDLPPALRALIFDKLLARDPAQRLPTMQDVRTELDAIMLPLDPAVSGRIALPVPPMAVTIATPAPRRARYLAVGAIVLLAGAGVAAYAIGTRHGAASVAQAPAAGPGSSSRAAIQVAADTIANGLTAQAQAARLRIEGLATAPMVRVAIETDTTTVKDMAAHESLFKRADAETLDLLQTQGGAVTSLVHLPEAGPANPALADAAALAAQKSARLVVSQGGLVLVAAEAVTRQDGTPGGYLVLATPVDLSLARTVIGKDAVDAKLVGLGASVPIVTGAAEHAERVSVPVPVDPALAPGPLSLEALVR